MGSQVCSLIDVTDVSVRCLTGPGGHAVIEVEGVPRHLPEKAIGIDKVAVPLGPTASFHDFGSSSMCLSQDFVDRVTLADIVGS